MKFVKLNKLNIYLIDIDIINIIDFNENNIPIYDKDIFSLLYLIEKFIPKKYNFESILSKFEKGENKNSLNIIFLKKLLILVYNFHSFF